MAAASASAEWTPWEWSNAAEYDTLAANGYVRNSAVASCMGEWAVRFPEPPLGQINDKGEIEFDTDALKPIKHNVVMSERLLMLCSILYAIIGGNAYLYKVKGKLGDHIGYFPFSDGFVTPKADPATGMLSHYSLARNGKKVRVEKDEIVHLRWPSIDPGNWLKSVSPLLQLSQDAETDNYFARAINSVLKNDATPKTAYFMDADAAKQGVEKLGSLQAVIEFVKQKWKEAFGGENLGSLGIFMGGKIERLGMNFEELNSEPLRKLPEARIAGVLKVPPIIAGLSVGLEAATYSNYIQARLTFVQDRLCPLWTQWADTLGKSLSDSDNPVTLVFDTSKVIALQDSRLEAEKRVIDKYKAKLITRNEARTELGYEKLEDAPKNELRETVGGATALQALQISYASGQIDQPMALATAELIFGFTPEEATQLFPERSPDLTPTQTEQV